MRIALVPAANRKERAVMEGSSRAILPSGRITAVRGSVVEVEFGSDLPAINEALSLRDSLASRTVILEVAHHLDPHTVRAIALAPHGGSGSGHGGPAQRATHRGAGRPRDAWPAVQRPGRTTRWAGAASLRGALADPSPVSLADGSGTRFGLPGDGDQGDRPAGSAGPRRQGRTDRRGRRRQDHPAPGTDAEYEEQPQRSGRLRRGRRTHPRGERPVAGDAGERRACNTPSWFSAR